MRNFDCMKGSGNNIFKRLHVEFSHASSNFVQDDVAIMILNEDNDEFVLEEKDREGVIIFSIFLNSFFFNVVNMKFYFLLHFKIFTILNVFLKKW